MKKLFPWARIILTVTVAVMLSTHIAFTLRPNGQEFLGDYSTREGWALLLLQLCCWITSLELMKILAVYSRKIRNLFPDKRQADRVTEVPGSLPGPPAV